MVDMRAFITASGTWARAKSPAALNNNWNNSMSSKHKRNISFVHPPRPGEHPEGGHTVTMAETDFGQTDFGHPYLTDFRQSDFG